MSKEVEYYERAWRAYTKGCHLDSSRWLELARIEREKDRRAR